MVRVFDQEVTEGSLARHETSGGWAGLDVLAWWSAHGLATGGDAAPSTFERGGEPEGWVAILAVIVDVWGTESTATAWVS